MHIKYKEKMKNCIADLRQKFIFLHSARSRLCAQYNILSKFVRNRTLRTFVHFHINILFPLFITTCTVHSDCCHIFWFTRKTKISICTSMSFLSRHFLRFNIVSGTRLSCGSRCFLSTGDSGDNNDALVDKKDDKTSIQVYKIPDEEPEIPKKHVFQELRHSQHPTPIYTLQEAAEYLPREGIHVHYKYPTLSQQHSDTDYALRGVDNQDTIIYHFPEVTDFLVVGSGLIGSATAYYLKKTLSENADVLVLDKAPYSPHNSTALCNGLISCQSKCRETTRVAGLSKELLRTLRNDILVTKEDLYQLKYRPVTHLVLWRESDADDVLESVDFQVEDGCFTEVKLPEELEKSFPWLKVQNSDVALGSHGNQDEALVDPIGLRNLYRTLAQGHGANFLAAEVIDFNTMYTLHSPEVTPMSAGCVVCRIPTTGELRNLGYNKILLSLGHNTPYLEARSEMEAYMRDQIDDLHFIQPKLRVYFSFHSLNAPVINFPVITDTDGSILIKDDYCGNFKYFLNYEDSEVFLDKDHTLFMDVDSDDPYKNLIHKSDMFKEYFVEVIKPKLVKRIPVMEDATFDLAYSGFESYNTHDGSPVLCNHPFHVKVLVSGGYGSRMTNFGPAVGMTLTELMLYDEERTFDMTKFYWNRVIKGRKVDEFSNLVA